MTHRQRLFRRILQAVNRRSPDITSVRGEVIIKGTKTIHRQRLFRWTVQLVRSLSILLIVLLLISLVAGAILSIIAPTALPTWSGLGPSQEITTTTRNGIEETRTVKDVGSKTLWDWAQLLIVPIILAIGGIWFNRQEKQRDQQREEQRTQDAVLQSYLDQMTELLLKHGLTAKQKERRAAESMEETITPQTDLRDEVRSVARARTLTAMHQLDKPRQALVIRFLADVNLVGATANIIDLAHLDLREVDFSGVNFSGANLSGADLSSANLDGTNFSGADLSSANLSRAYLLGANLSDTKLNYADLRRAILVGANLNNADLSGNGTLLDGAFLSSSTLNGANLSNSSLCEAQFSRADLSNADLSGAFLSEADFSNATLNGTNLSNSHLHMADFSGADLSNTDFSRAFLLGANFNAAKLPIDSAQSDSKSTSLSSPATIPPDWHDTAPEPQISDTSMQTQIYTMSSETGTESAEAGETLGEPEHTGKQGIASMPTQDDKADEDK